MTGGAPAPDDVVVDDDRSVELLGAGHLPHGRQDDGGVTGPAGLDLDAAHERLEHRPLGHPGGGVAQQHRVLLASIEVEVAVAPVRLLGDGPHGVEVVGVGGADDDRLGHRGEGSDVPPPTSKPSGPAPRRGVPCSP